MFNLFKTSGEMGSLGCTIRKINMAAGEVGREISRTGEKVQREIYFAGCDADRAVRKTIDKLRF